MGQEDIFPIFGKKIVVTSTFFPSLPRRSNFGLWERHSSYIIIRDIPRIFYQAHELSWEAYDIDSLIWLMDLLQTQDLAEGFLGL